MEVDDGSGWQTLAPRARADKHGKYSYALKNQAEGNSRYRITPVDSAGNLDTARESNDVAVHIG